MQHQVFTFLINTSTCKNCIQPKIQFKDIRVHVHWYYAAYRREKSQAFNLLTSKSLSWIQRGVYPDRVFDSQHIYELHKYSYTHISTPLSLFVYLSRLLIPLFACSSVYLAVTTASLHFLHFLLTHGNYVYCYEFIYSQAASHNPAIMDVYGT